MSIDANVHFYRYSPGASPSIDEQMALFQRDYLPEHIVPLLAAAGFDGCVVVQLLSDEDETRWLLDLAGHHDFIRGVVGWTDLLAIDVRERIGELANHPRLSAIRYAVHAQPGIMASEDFRHGIGALTEFSLPLDLLIEPAQFSEAIDLATAFPDQRFVLDSLGQPDARGGGFDAWARGIAAVSRRRNIWCKLSGVLLRSDWTAWSPEQVAPSVDTVLDWFGPERTMIGSDWPLCTLAGDYTTVMSALVDCIGRLPFGDQEAVLGGNAESLYRLATVS